MHVLVWTLPILSGLADAAGRSVMRLTTIRTYVLLAGGFAVTLPFYLAWLWIEGIPEIRPMFWVAIAMHVPLFACAQIMTVRAHRSSPLILTAPYLSLTPAFLLIVAPCFGGGTPTLSGALGVILITAGVYVLNGRQGQTSLLAPFRCIAHERGSQLMLAVAAIYAVTASLDYVALQNANAPLYLLVDHGGMAVTNYALALFFYRREPAQDNGMVRESVWWILVLYGITIAASGIPQMLAYRWIPVVPYVIAGKRTGLILFAVAIGVVIGGLSRFRGRYQSEREALWYRIPGTLFMVLGMILIIVWGKR